MAKTKTQAHEVAVPEKTLKQVRSTEQSKPRVGKASTSKDRNNALPKTLPNDKNRVATGQDNLDESIATKDSSLLADLFAQKIQKHYSDGTSIEAADRGLPSTAFRNTTDFEKPHTTSNLPAYLEHYTTGGQKELASCQEKGCPHTLVIAPSGIRTADLVRTLKLYNNSESKVAKLFAKHMKLADNVKFCQGTSIGIAVGTPTRLKDLIDASAIKPNNLKRIVIDGSYVDEKKRSIFDMAETFRPMLELVNHKQVRPKLGSEKDLIAIMVF